MASHISRPKADLYLCHKCNNWKPPSSFIRRGNKSGIIYAMNCNACRRLEAIKKLDNYFNKVKSDPEFLLKALKKWEAKRPIPNTDGWKKYYIWMMTFKSFKAKVGLVDKLPPFDIVTYVNRKVKYGRLTTQEAEERIESYYQRHPESRPKGG